MLRTLCILVFVAITSNALPNKRSIVPPTIRNSHSKNLQMGRIVNGHEATPHSRPFMISIQYYGSNFCGGSILDEVIQSFNHW